MSEMKATVRDICTQLLLSSLDPYTMAPTYIECHNALLALTGGEGLDATVPTMKAVAMHEDAHLEMDYEDRFFDRMSEEVDGDFLDDDEYDEDEDED